MTLRRAVLGFWILSMTLVVHTTADADPSWKIATGQFWPVSFVNGETTSGPTATSLRLGCSIPIGDKWVMYQEAGIAAPNSTFNPSPRAAIGPGYKVTDALLVGLAAAYQINPAHGNVTWTHSAAVSLLASTTISKGIAFVVSVGFGRGLRENGVWGMNVQPTMMFTLPI